MTPSKGWVINPTSGTPPTLFANTAPETYIAPNPSRSIILALRALNAPGSITTPCDINRLSCADRTLDETMLSDSTPYLQRRQSAATPLSVVAMVTTAVLDLLRNDATGQAERWGGMAKRSAAMSVP